ncbi:MAG TPA: tetratricopeptide repeat protein, partial [Burkholderiales bacterium]|nr:tetratricopeptide repeat protein [Burkholderiales bacterium]
TPAQPAPAPATFLGSAACAQCHPGEAGAWRGSQHQRAMQAAVEGAVLGNFDDARFTHGGVTSTFFRRDGRYFVNTDSPDGKLSDFEVRYTFGVAPLQQYLVELPGGRLQALGIAWDARPKAEGGQRWFHLYPGRKLKSGDPLHWTGIEQNWNYQCADCHSTNLRKGYDEAGRTFRTTWTDLNVGCEACHGPGSNHAAWAKKEGDWQRFEGNRGLTAVLDERRGAAWTIDAGTGNAVRSRPRGSEREIEVCARCHSRRGQFSDDHGAGRPLHDAFRPALLEPGLYFPDGQQRDEVYTYASFLQSRMHAMGVTCSDCHDPHSGTPRAPGNALCAQCHLPEKFDAAEHHRHRPGTPAAQCVACHMPATTYMVVDPRRDHSFRIPRPDRTLTLGVPNACNQCHVKESAKWAAEQLREWHPQPRPGHQSFAEALHAGDRGAPGAREALLAVAGDAGQPAIARASALARLGRYLSPSVLPVVAGALGDSDANVRLAAVLALAEGDPATRLRTLPRALTDPARAVRMEAARALAGEAEGRLAAADRGTFDKALAEYVAAQRFNADRPEAHAALGNLHASRGKPGEAEAAYGRALALDPTFVPASLNLADLQRATGDEDAAEQTLRAALARTPDSAPLHHALGLALIRQRQTAEALAGLARAAQLAPDDPRFAYVYGVALHDTGKRAEAIRTLRAALDRHPYDREILVALATYEAEGGNRAAAGEHARLLLELEPDNPAMAQFAASLGAQPAPAR